MPCSCTCLTWAIILCSCHLISKNSVQRRRKKGIERSRSPGRDRAHGLPPAVSICSGGSDCSPATLVRAGLPSGPAEGVLVTSHLPCLNRYIWLSKKIKTHCQLKHGHKACISLGVCPQTLYSVYPVYVKGERNKIYSEVASRVLKDFSLFSEDLTIQSSMNINSGQN